MVLQSPQRGSQEDSVGYFAEVSELGEDMEMLSLLVFLFLFLVDYVDAYL